jgi:hypothetical protein
LSDAKPNAQSSSTPTYVDSRRISGIVTINAPNLAGRAGEETERAHPIAAKRTPL